MHGSKLLIAWRAENGYRLADAGKLFGVSGTFVLNLEQGGSLPGIEVALRIEQVSRGRIPIESWLRDADARRDARELLIDRARREAQTARILRRREGAAAALAAMGATGPTFK